MSMLDSCMLHGLAGEMQLCATCLLEFMCLSYVSVLHDASKCYANLLPQTDATSEVAVVKTEGGRWRGLCLHFCVTSAGPRLL